METRIRIVALHKGSTESLQDIIYRVEYYLTLVESGITRTETMTQSLSEADGSSFVPYDDLTEENVESWITSHPQYSNQIEVIRHMIFEESMSKVEDNFPWES